MSKINFRTTVTIDEAKDIIKTTGDVITNVIISEPGVGKSTILKMLEEEMGTEDYDYIYVDCPVKDMMDVAASIPNHETKALEYYVSSLFKLGNGKAKVIMLDEMMKSPKLMQIIYTRLMLERSVGDEPLPVSKSGKKSIVFATSNNVTDGVGDAMLDHAGNRVCKVEMAKPTAERWNIWASMIDPETNKPRVARPLRAWAAMNPKAFASYLDGDQEDNPYIFNPTKKGRQFVSPRSLTKASVFVDRRDQITENALVAGLSGTLGEAAAKSIAAFIALESRLIRTSDVVRDPTGVSVPQDVSALVMMMLEAVDTLKTQDDLDKYMQFVKRIPQSEVQAVFFTLMMRSRPKLARYNEEITKWAVANNYIM
jgi:MoxR-like ATPase